MKGDIAANHYPLNKYKLEFTDLTINVFTEIGGFEEELEAVDMPDRTRASGGNTKPAELTLRVPLHHASDLKKMDKWFKDCQGNVATNYKKTGTLTNLSLTNAANTAYAHTLEGCFLTKRAFPDQAMENEGGMAYAEYTMSIDDVVPAAENVPA